MIATLHEKLSGRKDALCAVRDRLGIPILDGQPCERRGAHLKIKYATQRRKKTKDVNNRAIQTAAFVPEMVVFVNPNTDCEGVGPVAIWHQNEKLRHLIYR